MQASIPSSSVTLLRIPRALLVAEIVDFPPCTGVAVEAQNNPGLLLPQIYFEQLQISIYCLFIIMPSATPPFLRIAIIGGGPGGLGAAIALSALLNVEVTVYEQVKELREIGAGI